MSERGKYADRNYRRPDYTSLRYVYVLKQGSIVQKNDSYHVSAGSIR